MLTLVAKSIALTDWVLSRVVRDAKFITVTGSVESLEQDDYVGPDLAYLLGAILNDTGCAWPPDRAIVTILRQHFPDDSPVHRFIEIESE